MDYNHPIKQQVVSIDKFILIAFVSPIWLWVDFMVERNKYFLVESWNLMLFWNP